MSNAATECSGSSPRAPSFKVSAGGPECPGAMCSIAASSPESSTTRTVYMRPGLRGTSKSWVICIWKFSFIGGPPGAGPEPKSKPSARGSAGAAKLGREGPSCRPASGPACPSATITSTPQPTGPSSASPQAYLLGLAERGSRRERRQWPIISPSSNSSVSTMALAAVDSCSAAGGLSSTLALSPSRPPLEGAMAWEMPRSRSPSLALTTYLAAMP
mmetsp:Transcript_56294/g.182812  ORF Transcript_56294/g.182812 Transcript_56294/m.182812 type:complete len:216 (-) Transcript_56294:448-1095(-)